MSAPFFPYDGSAVFIETEGDKASVEQFVNNDPYVKNKLVTSYEIKEFDITISKRFERISGDFLLRT